MNKTGVGIDGILSFDHTYSTAPVIAETLREFGNITRRLSRIPDLRLGVNHHGDYESRPWVSTLPLTNNFPSVERFLRGIVSDGGSGRGANYAQTLMAARKADWRAEKARFIILAGDEIPREPSRYTGEYRVDWENELGLLKEMGVRIFAVQLLNNSHATSFYKALASRTGGVYLPLHQMYQLPMIVASVVLLQESPEAFADYEREARRRDDFTNNMSYIFDAIGGRTTPSCQRTGGRLTTGLRAVHPSRFQMFRVPDGDTVSIKQFVQDMGLRFAKGRGFYRHDTRTETVQDYKEIILQDKVTGEFFTGPDARRLLGMPSSGHYRLRHNPLPDYWVWIQSTSVNRTLNRDGNAAWFMYEAVDDGAAGTSAKPKRRKKAKTTLAGAGAPGSW